MHSPADDKTGDDIRVADISLLLYEIHHQMVISMYKSRVHSSQQNWRSDVLCCAMICADAEVNDRIEYIYSMLLRMEFSNLNRHLMLAYSRQYSTAYQ